MAQLDSSIYFQQQAPDILGNIQRGLSMRDMLDKRAQNQRLLAEEEAERAAYKAGITQNPDGTTGFDSEKAASALLVANPQKGLEFKQQQRTQQAAASKTSQEAVIQNAKTFAQFGSAAIENPSAWPSIRAELIKSGVGKENELPEAYDDNFMKNRVGMALSYTDRYTRDKDAKELELKNKASQRDDARLDLERQKIAIERAKATGKGGMSDGIKALDKDYAKDYNDWTSMGRNTVDKNLDRLRAAKEALKNDPSLTGSIRGMAPDWVRNSTNENAIQTRDDVRAAAQGALKATLGAQFTEKEGERIMNQSYNEKLSPEANIAKIDAAIKELESGRENNERKVSHFQKHGSLKGYEGQSKSPEQKQAGGVPILKSSQIEW